LLWCLQTARRTYRRAERELSLPLTAVKQASSLVHWAGIALQRRSTVFLKASATFIGSLTQSAVFSGPSSSYPQSTAAAITSQLLRTMRALQGSVPKSCSNAPLLARPGSTLSLHQQAGLARHHQQQRCGAATSIQLSTSAPWPAQHVSPHHHSRRTLVSAAAAPAAAAPGQQVDATALEQLRSKLQLHNSMSRRKELFRPRPEMGNKVQMYVCGVTVYDYSHIGAQGRWPRGFAADRAHSLPRIETQQPTFNHSLAWRTCPGRPEDSRV
jgi:hypothetical protein